MSNTLTGRRILVTGGAKRVGAAIVRALAAAGAEVVIHCDRSPAEAEALAAELPKATVIQRRFGQDARAGAEELIAACGRLDGLVNNASLYRQGTDEELLAVNFEWPLWLMAALIHQEGEPEAVVVNMLDSQVSAQSDVTDMYTMSKYRLRLATLACATEFAPRVRVNAVAPGPTLPPDEIAHLGMKKSIAAMPLKRPVAAEDVAAAVVFLMANNSMTGAILDVDCGMRLSI